MKNLLFIFTILFSMNSYSAESLGAHVHGVAGLDLAVEGNQLLIMFKSPSDSIIGFEYKAKTAEEKKSYANAKKDWMKEFYSLMGSGFESCKLSDQSWKQHFTGKKHSEILGEVIITCKKPMMGQKLKVSLIEKYPKIETIHVQLIRGDGSAFSKKYTAKKFEINL